MTANVLRSRIRSLRERSSDMRYFAPLGRLRSCLDKESVCAALREAGLEFQEIARTAEVIVHGGQKTFAILLTIHEESAISDFIAWDQMQCYSLDYRLPVQKASIAFLLPDTAERFYEEQWTFVAPVFSRNFHHRNLDRLTIMPFIRSESLGEGAFGTVYEVELHPQHHELHYLSKEGRVRIVQKKIKRRPVLTRSISGEERILSILNGLSHPNILELLGSYTLRDELSLIFPLASHTLKSFLSCEGRPPGFVNNTDILTALPGLASGLQTLHCYVNEGVSFIGCHHDLKPDNVLVMDGKFVLADFGLSTFKESTSNSDTYFQVGQSFYFAPECEDYENSFRTNRIGRASDIWSFGCILLETLVFMAHGATGVEKFTKDRKVTFGGYFITSTFHHGKKPNAAVHDYLLRLQGTASEEALVLLVKLIRDMLNLQPDGRPNAQRTLERIRHVAIKHAVNTVQSLFRSLQRLKVDVDLIIEKERFDSWLIVLSGALEKTNNIAYRILDNQNVYDSAITTLFETINVLTTAIGQDGDYRIATLRVRQLNDSLSNLMDELMQRHIMKEVELRILEAEDLETLHRIGESFRDVPAYRRVGTLAALKHMHVLFQDQEKLDTEDMMLDRDNFYDFDDTRSHSFTIARSGSNNVALQDVLIQWIVYDERWAGNAGNVLFSRIGAIAKQLRTASQIQSLHILDCHGYFHQPRLHSFGMVFACPCSENGGKANPWTLRHLIQKTKNVRARPELGQLFKLAHQVASSILEYHTIGWLHKNISSHNILFFASSVTSPPDVSTPWIIGFDHSRPNRPSEFSDGPWGESSRLRYQHPLYRNGLHKFRPEFDYFSFGLVLLEIGLWKALDDIWSPESASTKDHHISISRILAEELPLLKPRIGTMYHDAARACLTVDVDEDPASVLSSPPWFRSQVVEKLSRCIV